MKAYESSSSATECARKLNVSVVTVYRKIRRYDLPTLSDGKRGPEPVITPEQALEAYQREGTLAGASSRLGVSAPTVRRYLTPEQLADTEPQDRAIIESFTAGSITDLAARLNQADGTVRGKLRRAVIRMWDLASDRADLEDPYFTLSQPDTPREIKMFNAVRNDPNLVYALHADDYQSTIDQTAESIGESPKALRTYLERCRVRQEHLV